MKKLLFPLLFGVFSIALQAQELAPTLLTPAGGYIATAQGSLSWSTGEVAVAQTVQSQHILSQGFQQIDIDTNTIALPDDLNKIKALIPNLITPNGDGFHDVFDPVGALRDAHLQVSENQAELTIVNRWGEVVYLATHLYHLWDATSSTGALLPQATYYYILVLHRSRDITIRGTVHLLR